MQGFSFQGDRDADFEFELLSVDKDGGKPSKAMDTLHTADLSRSQVYN